MKTLIVCMLGLLLSFENVSMVSVPNKIGKSLREVDSSVIGLGDSISEIRKPKCDLDRNTWKRSIKKFFKSVKDPTSQGVKCLDSTPVADRECNFKDGSSNFSLSVMADECRTISLECKGRLNNGFEITFEPPRSGDPMYPHDVFTEEQRKSGAVIVHVIGILYMFYALAMVCHHYFVPSLDIIIELCGISADVAGATFMAAGGSAPEFFTSLIGVFIAVSDVGIGTIVGSAVFNVLFVIAACAFVSAEALKLTVWPLLRDSAFYTISLLSLLAFFIDDFIEWWESLLLFLWYCAYIVCMKFNSLLEVKFLDICSWARPSPLVPDQELENCNRWDEKKDQTQATKVEYTEINKDKYKDMEYRGYIKSGPVGGIFSKAMWLISLPFMIPLWLTIPDPQDNTCRKYFPITFFISILWIAVFSYFMVWWANITGETIGISDAVMGLTLLAAGTSVPDLISSVLVAKEGNGDMAVSSSIGSNIFDVTVGLPIPWLLYSLINQRAMEVNSTGLLCSIGMLFVMLLLVVISIIAFKWKMTKSMGGVMIALYIAFVVVSLGLSECWFPCPF